MKKIGIIGNGFVGNSVAFGFSPTHEIRIHDKDPKKEFADIGRLVIIYMNASGIEVEDINKVSNK